MLSAIILQDFLSGKLSECQGLGLKSNSDFKDFFELKLFLVLFFLRGKEAREDYVQVNL